MPWLTPNSPLPTETTCRQLVIPNDPEIIMAVNGALLPLIYAHNWEAHGSATPEQMAAAMSEMFFAYIASECEEIMSEYVSLGIAKYGVFKTQGTPGGTPTEGAWTAVTGLSQRYRTIGGVVITSGTRLKFPAGLYEFEASQIVYETEASRLRLWNYTQDTEIWLGDSQYFTSEDNATGRMMIDGVVDLNGSDEVQLEYWIERNNEGNRALGRATDIPGMGEWYASLTFRQLRAEVNQG